MSTMAIVGYTGSGKSHFAALLYLHLNKIADHRKLKVTADVDSHQFDVKETANGLRYGIPLKPTPPGRSFQAAIEVEFPGLFKDKRVHMPIIDLSGEAFSDIMGTAEGHASGNEEKPPAKSSKRYGVPDEKLSSEQREIFEADAYCFIIDLPQELQTSRVNVEYSRFFQSLRAYREAHALGPPRTVSFIFTKEDECQDLLAERLGEAPTADQLTRYFAPDLHVEVRSSIYGPVHSFISSTKWHVPPEGDGNRGEFEVLLDAQSGQPIPNYPQQTYDQIVDWINDF
ncbi:MAG: hypothetical protein IIC82_06590 [Chloroflexi bacterium]|nr:hypothetical protein [Chloroflexota bacterium]